MESGKIIELSEDEPFCFDCQSLVPCFNECCRDLNQFLTPYDIVRLKNHFKLSSSDFLKRYTTEHIGPQTGLPVITITPADRFERICPFVTPSGCSVYKNRPSSCRMYPVVRVLSRSREDGKKEIRYALLKENHCRGFEQKRQLTVREWMAGQGLSPYNGMNDLMMDIISLKNQYIPGPLKGDAQQLFYTMCYDIDRLKEVGTVPGLEKIEISDEVQNDDAELLRFGMNYLKNYFLAHQSI
ncbi:MAG: YkgJ family cysteine cluster protein [Desulfobacteraceae bacterium]|nr:YkgJ family cysteine cluster protein [Desulfobacteraceae bacterium]MBC2754433.1 YkgJ family cysteine cluster protein [Desulfobacteraceae bacterium]